MDSTGAHRRDSPRPGPHGRRNPNPDVAGVTGPHSDEARVGPGSSPIAHGPVPNHQVATIGSCITLATLLRRQRADGGIALDRDTTEGRLLANKLGGARMTSEARIALGTETGFVTRYPKASDIPSPPCLLRLLPAGPNRRMGLAPTGKRRLVTAHMESGYSITSSARASVNGGIVRPSAVAVLRLTTSSNLVGRRKGKSAGFSPLRIRAV